MSIADDARSSHVREPIAPDKAQSEENESGYPPIADLEADIVEAGRLDRWMAERH